ncbi:hypothetical protein OO012_19365 [Rhodobacteraceae bacterium KMM 6894]|nr:hypothetical protein [Rhodobacteraceae bacterium KMM 6894]
MRNSLDVEGGRKLRPLSMLVVRLPLSETISLASLLIAASVTRQTLQRWREKRGFPKTLKDGPNGWFSTNHIAEWFIAQSVEVVRK